MQIHLHNTELQAIAESVAAMLLPTLQQQIFAAIELNISGMKASGSHGEQETDDDLLSQTQVAGMVGMSEAWLEKKRVTGGGIPYVKKGRNVGYLRSDVKVWLNSRRFTNTSGGTPE